MFEPGALTNGTMQLMALSRQQGVAQPQILHEYGCIFLVYIASKCKRDMCGGVRVSWLDDVVSSLAKV
jgi:hypothetical protein